MHLQETASEQGRGDEQSVESATSAPIRRRAAARPPRHRAISAREGIAHVAA